MKSWTQALRPTPAVIAFALFFVVSAILGEVFPFSRFEMYCESGYRRGGVLVFRADGREVSIDDYDAFAGFDVGALRYPPGEHFESEYKLDEVRHALESHRAQGEVPASAVRFEIGVRIVEAASDGPRVVEAFAPMAEGRAWRRD